MAPGAPKTVKDSWGEQVLVGIHRKELPRVQKAFIESPNASVNETVRKWNKLFYGGYYLPSGGPAAGVVEGDTALHVAVRADELEIVRFLFTLFPKPDLNAKNKPGKTPIELAKTEAMKDLLQLNDFSF